MKKKSIKATFIPRTKGSRKNNQDVDNQPPRNIITEKVLINIIEPYSARKKSAKPMLAYSTLNPETNSDSASGRSKGALFVSARMETRNIRKSGKKGTAKTI
jgi:hypothetical protein